MNTLTALIGFPRWPTFGCLIVLAFSAGGWADHEMRAGSAAETDIVSGVRTFPPKNGVGTHRTDDPSIIDQNMAVSDQPSFVWPSELELVIEPPPVISAPSTLAPLALARGPDATIVMLSVGNPTVLRFTSVGQLIGQFSDPSWVTDDPPCEGPSDLAVGADDSIWIVDNCNLEIERRSMTGDLLHSWLVTGPGEPTELALKGIAVGADTVYAVQPNLARVLRFSLEGELLGAFGSAGTGPGQFDFQPDMLHPSQPVGILSGEDRVYIADSGNRRVQILTREGDYLSEWDLSEAGAGTGDFNIPLALDQLATGEMAVLVARASAGWISPERQILVYQESAGITRIIGEECFDYHNGTEACRFTLGGGPDYAIQAAFDVVALPDGVYVGAETKTPSLEHPLGGSILHFSPYGELLGQWGDFDGTTGQHIHVHTIGEWADGNIFVSTYGGDFRVYSRAGVLSERRVDWRERPAHGEVTRAIPAGWNPLPMERTATGVISSVDAYSSSHSANGVADISMDGEIQSWWAPPGSYSAVHDLRLDSEGHLHILATDTDFHTLIEVRDADGNVLRAGRPPLFARRMELLDDGRYALVEPGNPGILVFDPAVPDLILVWDAHAEPRSTGYDDVSRAPDGTLLVPEAAAGLIHRFTQDGMLLGSWSGPPGYSMEPSSVSVTEDGDLLVGGLNGVSIFGSDSYAWRAAYYGNEDVAGEPLTGSRLSGSVVEWEARPPTDELARGVWSGRLDKWMYLDEGTTDINVTVIGGARLSVDGATILDRWEQPGTNESVGVDVASGYHAVALDFRPTGPGRAEIRANADTAGPVPPTDAPLGLEPPDAFIHVGGESHASAIGSHTWMPSGSVEYMAQVTPELAIQLPASDGTRFEINSSEPVQDLYIQALRIRPEHTPHRSGDRFIWTQTDLDGPPLIESEPLNDQTVDLPLEEGRWIVIIAASWDQDHHAQYGWLVDVVNTADGGDSTTAYLPVNMNGY